MCLCACVSVCVCVCVCARARVCVRARVRARVRVFTLANRRCGMRTVDVGAPQLAMHSVREMCGTEDVKHSVALFTAFYREFPAIDASIVAN